MKNKALYAGISLLLLSSLGLTGCSSNVITVANEDVTVNVKTAAAFEGYLNNGPIFTGTVQANKEITIDPKVSGRIANIPVEVGATITKGDVLFTLEDEDLKNSTLQSEAAVGVAQSGIAAAKSGYESGVVAAENGVEQARTTVNQLQNSLEDLEASAKKASQSLVDAKNNFNRTKELFAAGAVSKTQVEQAETALVAAESAVTSIEVNKKNTFEKLTAAETTLKNAQKQLGIARNNPQVKVSEEQLKQAQAAAAIANHTLREATVVSPISGTIGAINSEAGEIVSSQTHVMVIADLSEVRILVYVPAGEVNNINVGDPVQVRTVSTTMTTVGTVNNISPLDQDGKGYPVEIVVSNPEGILKPGMISEVMFVHKDEGKGVIIPKSALLEKNNKQYVYKIEENHTVLTEVTVGEMTDSQALISSGLTVKDRVATTKIKVLADHVKIVEE
ncbi:MAG TPA: efflux RND transporter periplasmic adaptor subunit [Bacillus bacterium]|nr:efflux RND transporter periplasmic adaptor subunit [Bacillus sp. (in: firmicutes)]